MAEIRRKIYKRGSSYETTIPMPLLFACDLSRKHDIIFRFDSKTNRWYIEIAESASGKKGEKKARQR